MGLRSQLAGAVAALVAVMCTTGAAAAHQAGQGALPNLDYANGQVNQFETLPVFTAPGPAFHAARARGKTVFVIPSESDSTPPGLVSLGAYVAGMRQAAKHAGVKLSVCPTHGTVTQWAACMTTAIGHKVGVIDLVGPPDPSRLQPQIAAAKQAGIPVIAANVLSPSDFSAYSGTVAPSYASALEGLTATVPAPYAQAAALMADYVTADRSGAPTNILILTASDQPESAGMLAVVQNEFANVCGPNCSTSVLDVPAADWSTEAIPEIKNAVLAQPTEFIVSLFDGVSSLAAEGIADARQSLSTVTRPSICTFGGASWVIQMGQDNNRIECDVSENMNWDGWAAMDQTLRVLSGVKPVATENVPLLLWSDDNWSTEGQGLAGVSFPPVLDGGWGDAYTTYIDEYLKLWGLRAGGAT